MTTAMTPVDTVDVLADVDQLVAGHVTLARATYGRLPALGSAEWRAAPDTVRTAVLLVAAEAWLVRELYIRREIDSRLKHAAIDLAAAADWSRVARDYLSYPELQHRRTS